MRADAQRNREKVLEAAEAVFAASGPSASTEEVARRAGVGVGTVFRHFPTKEALLQAILEDRLTRLAEQAERLAREADPGSGLYGLFAHMVEQSAAKRTYAQALADAGLDPEVAMSKVGERVREALGRLLAGAQKARAVRDDLGINELLALVVGASQAVDYGRRDSEVQERTLRVFLDGLRPQPDTVGP